MFFLYYAKTYYVPTYSKKELVIKLLYRWLISDIRYKTTFFEYLHTKTARIGRGIYKMFFFCTFYLDIYCVS